MQPGNKGPSTGAANSTRNHPTPFQRSSQSRAITTHQLSTTCRSPLHHNATPRKRSFCQFFRFAQTKDAGEKVLSTAILARQGQWESLGARVARHMSTIHHRAKVDAWLSYMACLPPAGYGNMARSSACMRPTGKASNGCASILDGEVIGAPRLIRNGLFWRGELRQAEGLAAAMNGDLRDGQSISILNSPSGR
jgi:hypothetical protein